MAVNPTPVVLVVEDEWLLCDDATKEFRVAGFVVLETANAEDALKIARDADRLDVLFTDIELAGDLSGYELAEQVREMLPEVSVLYASGTAADVDRQVPGSRFFDKPYDLAEVVGACRS